MKSIGLAFLLSAFLVACQPEPETDFSLVFKNELDVQVNITIFWSITNSDSAFVKDVIMLIPNGSGTLVYNAEGAEYENFPTNVIAETLRSDSIIVSYSDTLFVRHYPRHITSISSQSALDSTAIFYNQLRNIYNASSYEQSKKGENWFEGRYMFTQSDLEYAISIHE